MYITWKIISYHDFNSTLCIIITMVYSIKTRFDTTWLYSECYMYRRLIQSMAASTELRDFDFFAGQKKDSFKDNLVAIEG